MIRSFKKFEGTSCWLSNYHISVSDMELMDWPIDIFRVFTWVSNQSHFVLKSCGIANLFSHQVLSIGTKQFTDWVMVNFLAVPSLLPSRRVGLSSVILCYGVLCHILSCNIMLIILRFKPITHFTCCYIIIAVSDSRGLICLRKWFWRQLLERRNAIWPFRILWIFSQWRSILDEI
jgi:hypothetical protein